MDKTLLQLGGTMKAIRKITGYGTSACIIIPTRIMHNLKLVKGNLVRISIEKIGEEVIEQKQKNYASRNKRLGYEDTK